MARSFRQMFVKARESVAYWAELAVLDFTADMERVMETKKVNRAELGRRIGASKAYVTKVFNGRANFTVKSMVTLAYALDCRVRIRLTGAELQRDTGWKDAASVVMAKSAAILVMPISTDQAANDWVFLKAA